MTKDGDPYENIIAERIKGILKDDFGIVETLPTQNEAIKII
jgi:putative transposase